MANLSIPSIRERLFNTSKHEQTTQRNSNSTNPFAASSFKGNVLTADVFESSSKKADQPSFTGKLKASALVGSISGIGEKFHNMIESAKAFGNRMKKWLNRLNEVEISFTPAKEKAVSIFNSAIEKLTTPVSDLIPQGVSAKSVSKMDDMIAVRQLATDKIAMWEAAEI